MTKRVLISAFACLLFLTVSAQEKGGLMNVKKFNTSSFSKDITYYEEGLTQQGLFPDSLVHHPDMGIVPYNTQCQNCIELLGKRTVNGRYYIDKSDPETFYVQQSYFPLHYKDANGFWVTIDPRLRPLNTSNGLYEAKKQPVPTFFNPKDQTSGIVVGGHSVEFNGQVSLFFTDNNGHTTSFGTPDHSNFSVGDEGVLTPNIWPDIDLRRIYRASGIKSSYFINKPLGLANGNLFFEDRFQIPDGWKLQKDRSTGNEVDGYWSGDYVLINDQGTTVMRFERPTYYDGYSYGMFGYYNYFEDNGRQVLQIVVPADFLNDSLLHYPLQVDPYVYGYNITGVPQAVDPIGTGANMAFSQFPQTCDYFMSVTVPGKSEIVDTLLLDIEYRNEFSPGCGIPQPGCEFDDVQMQLFDITCGSSTGYLSCNPLLPPYNGTCTTDSNTYLPARALPIPNMLGCHAPQCPDYVIDFRLQNSEDPCPETCGHNCAIGTFWAVTIKARTIENTINISRDVICAGDTVTLTAFPDYGVPPYHYEWSPGGLTDSIIVVASETNTIFYCTAYDACNNAALEVDTLLTVNPSPDADAGPDVTMCKGESAGLGGNPTTTSSLNPSFQWTAQPAYASSWIIAPGSSNPSFQPPADSSGTFLLIVRVEDQTCFRRDTAIVTINEDPVPTLVPDSNLIICSGSSTELTTLESYASYAWSTSETTSSIFITDPGNYSVTVTDSAGCVGSSNTVTASLVPVPSVDIIATPGTEINLDESTTLSSTLDLNGPDVDSYNWSPDLNISCLTCPEPIVSPQDDQTYYLNIISGGCELVDSILIDVQFPNAYWIPKAFSPNDDGLNDYFYVITESGVTVVEFKIFNRWGEKIYDSLHPWNGQYKGEYQDIGVYPYYIVLRLSDGTEVKEKGNVTIVK